MDEIENPVLCRIEAGNESRPCHRTLRRSRRSESHEASLIPQACEIRKISPMSLDKFRVHAIDPNHDHLPAIRVGAMTASSSSQHYQQTECDVWGRQFRLPAIVWGRRFRLPAIVTRDHALRKSPVKAFPPSTLEPRCQTN